MYNGQLVDAAVNAVCIGEIEKNVRLSKFEFVTPLASSS